MESAEGCGKREGECRAQFGFREIADSRQPICSGAARDRESYLKESLEPPAAEPRRTKARFGRLQTSATVDANVRCFKSYSCCTSFWRREIITRAIIPMPSKARLEGSGVPIGVPLIVTPSIASPES